MKTSSVRPKTSPNSRPSFGVRAQRGIALLAAIGFLAAIGVGAAVSFHMVSGENNVQHQLLKERIAFYAAEAGLAESRAVIRSLWTLDSGFNNVFSDLTGASPATTPLNRTGPAFGVPGPCNDTSGTTKATPCLYELLPSTPYAIRPDADHNFSDNLSDDDSEYYPEQANVSFRSFYYDDEDDSDFTGDSNRQFWVVSVGEVQTDRGRPIRAIVRALVTGPMPSESSVGYSGQKGGDSSKQNSTY